MNFIPMHKIALLVSIGLSLSCQSFFITRVIQWNNPSITDYELFPERVMNKSENVFTFSKDSTKFEHERINADFSKKYHVQTFQNLEDLLVSTGSTAFIVLKDDRLIYEKYFNGYSRNSVNTSFSTSKSVTSALIGIALDEGYLRDVDDPITQYLPELGGEARYDAITIKHLLMMSSGIAYSTENRFLGDRARAYYEPDLREYALKFSIESPPNTHFEYNNIHPLLLGMILERTTGRNVATYLEDKIWGPLGMEFQGSWSLDNSGFEKMESGINGRAIDFLKFGRLFLNEGKWDDEQIISTSWVEESTSRVPTNPVLNGIIREISYKYFWWIYPRYDGPDDYYAEGNLGQFIYVSPRTNTVIVRHGKEYGYNRWPEFLFRLTNDIANIRLNDNPFDIILEEHGVEKAIAFVDSTILNGPPIISEYHLNNVGYSLLAEDRLDDAITVFRLNTRSYPISSNVYDSLGEAYLKSQQTELAIENYKKSVELNPNNDHGLTVLEELGVERP